jgi:hypothetical protein
MQKSPEFEIPRIIIDFRRQHLSPQDLHTIEAKIGNGESFYFDPKSGFLDNPPDDYLKSFQKIVNLPPINPDGLGSKKKIEKEIVGIIYTFVNNDN